MEEITLNEDQVAGLKRLEDWLSKSTTLLSSTRDKQIRVVGPAGTGKTTLLKYLIAKRDTSSWAFTAPTNKASRVMRQMLSNYAKNFGTIYSLLGLRMSHQEDRIVLTAPVQEQHSSAYEDFTIKATTDDTGIVTDVHVIPHPSYPSFQVYLLAVDLDTGDSINLTVAHEDSEDAIMRRLQELSADARRPKQHHLWKVFWKFKESFHSIKYANAITCHRAQGSTFKTVFVDANDVLRNQNREEALRCLYVGISRPSTKLFVH